MSELREYQQELLEQAEAALQPPRARVMLQLPTGGGKTHIAGALLSQWLRDGRKAAWLTHRTELAEQTRRMLVDTGLSAVNQQTWATRSEAPAILNGVVVLMAQTVGRRASVGRIWREYGAADLLVIDEAHHATADGWRRAIDQWQGRIIGLTATPWRLSKPKSTDGRREGWANWDEGAYKGESLGSIGTDVTPQRVFSSRTGPRERSMEAGNRVIVRSDAAGSTRGPGGREFGGVGSVADSAVRLGVGWLAVGPRREWPAQPRAIPGEDAK